MLLIITNSEDATANYLAETLNQARVPFVRFDTDRSLESARLRYSGAGAQLALEGTWYKPEDFRNVWYRRPERLRVSQAEETPELKFLVDEWSEAIEGYFAHIPSEKWMNHPANEAVAHHKLQQLSRAQALGFKVPDTLVTQDPEELHEFFCRHGGRLITKPMARGHIARGGDAADTVIFTNRVRAEHLEQTEDVRCCPTLFQEEIAKRADVRITVVDDDIHAVELRALDADGLQRCDIRRSQIGDVEYTVVDLPGEIAGQIRSLTRGYGLRFGAIDMAISEQGAWVFFEINPNGQWAWMDLEGVTDIASSFVRSFK